MTDRRRVGLLQAGYVHPDVARLHGDYPALFTTLLAPFDLDVVAYDLQEGERPSSLDDHDGWLISGSASSAYDDEPWIHDLEDLSRDLVAGGHRTVGICFGHQVLAQALGGVVEKASAGWGVGVHRYHLTGDRPPWIDPSTPDPLRVVASHQDQVVALPDGARPLLRSAFCPNAGFTIGDHVLTVQPHPEFTPALSGALLALRRDQIGPATADEAAATLDDGTDAPTIAGWIAAFLRSR